MFWFFFQQHNINLKTECFSEDLDGFWGFCIRFLYLMFDLCIVSHQQLMNKVLGTPHDPYVTIDNTFWPPYVEMLLRYGIAVRHQENNFKIRLETF